MKAITIEPENVEKIYVGADHACRCGCRGTYYYPDHKLFVTVLATATKRANENDFELSGSYLNVSLLNNRAITVYFKKS